ncbi:Putative glycosyltransferase EpsD [Brevundimonas subvibrioides]|uniref:glycosyltransferase n=1 Tax=Brevundimonas subvibrioides TaxID=74313 RepID=UPI0032D57D34
MVIVHVLTRLLRAGSEENTLATARAQVAAGHRVVIVFGREWDATVRASAEAFAEVVCIEAMVHPIHPVQDPVAVRRMADLFKRLGADVVHTHQSKAGVLGRLAARIARVPCVIHGVHILPFVNVGQVQAVVYVAAERFCAGFTDAFISVSPSVRDACIERSIGAPDRHFVAFSAMDVARFRDPVPPADGHELLGVEAGRPRPPTAVMLAAFEPRKRQLELIRAIPGAFAGLSDWRVLFAGEGETLAEARALVDSLGLSDRIRFAGYRSDPQAIIALADVCLLTSLREGLPRVLVQYAAAGKPAVVSDLPGVTDVIEHDVSALITPGDDVAAAAVATARLLADPAERDRLARGAARIDVEAWTADSMNAAIARAYAAVAARQIKLAA